MLIQTSRSLLSPLTQRKVIPVVENRTQLVQILDAKHISAVLLRYCNLFELTSLLKEAHRRNLATYINIDHIDGINPDAAGLRFIAEQLAITGIISTHARILSLSKSFGLETIQRIFAIDSTGLEMALETVDSQSVDLLEISPALVIPYIMQSLPAPLPLPFIGSGLISTPQQVRTILLAGALGVAVARPELWQ